MNYRPTNHPEQFQITRLSLLIYWELIYLNIGMKTTPKMKTTSNGTQPQKEMDQTKSLHKVLKLKQNWAWHCREPAYFKSYMCYVLVIFCWTVRYILFTGSIPVRYILFTGSVPVRYILFTGTVRCFKKWGQAQKWRQPQKITLILLCHRAIHKWLCQAVVVFIFWSNFNFEVVFIF